MYQKEQIGGSARGKAEEAVITSNNGNKFLKRRNNLSNRGQGRERLQNARIPSQGRTRVNADRYRPPGFRGRHTAGPPRPLLHRRGRPRHRRLRCPKCPLRRRGGRGLPFFIPAAADGTSQRSIALPRSARVGYQANAWSPRKEPPSTEKENPMQKRIPQETTAATRSSRS